MHYCHGGAYDYMTAHYLYNSYISNKISPSRRAFPSIHQQLFDFYLDAQSTLLCTLGTSICLAFYCLTYYYVLLSHVEMIYFTVNE